jgi:uncharacterized damage-inducible protein DinB
MPTPTTLAPFYNGWENFQSLLVDAVAPLTDEQLLLTSASHLRTAGFLATHIISAREVWWHEALHEGGPWSRKTDKWDEPGQPVRTAAELVEGLQRSWALIEESLARWTPDMLDDEFTWTRRSGTQTFTRQWVIWHVLEHDLVHGGELFLTLGMHGIAVPDF